MTEETRWTRREAECRRRIKLRRSANTQAEVRRAHNPAFSCTKTCECGRDTHEHLAGHCWYFFKDKQGVIVVGRGVRKLKLPDWCRRDEKRREGQTRTHKYRVSEKWRGDCHLKISAVSPGCRPPSPLGLALSSFLHHLAAMTAPLDVPSDPHEFLQLPVPVALAGPPGSSRRRKTKTARFAGIKVHCTRFIKRIGADTPSDSSAVADSSFESNQAHPRTDDDVDGDEVDEIVVDRDWTEDLRSSLNQPSERGPTRSLDSQVQIGTSLGRDTIPMPDDSHFFSASLWSLRWKVWPAIVKFFCGRFFDDRTEARFHKEHWFIKKVALSFLPLQIAPPAVPSRWYCGPVSSLS